MPDLAHNESRREHIQSLAHLEWIMDPNASRWRNFDGHAVLKLMSRHWN